MFFLYFHKCHYAGFDGSTRVVTIGCEFHLVDLNFIGAFCDASIEFPVDVFYIWSIGHKPFIELSTFVDVCCIIWIHDVM